MKGELDKAREHVTRLRETAMEHEVHKYIAVAHQLMAQVSMASGDLAEAEQHFDAAFAELDNYPAPLVAWKTYAGAARLKLQQGDTAGAQEAAEKAAEVVNSIAANVNDDKLRDTFLKAVSTDYADLHNLWTVGARGEKT